MKCLRDTCDLRGTFTSTSQAPSTGGYMSIKLECYFVAMVIGILIYIVSVEKIERISVVDFLSTWYHIIAINWYKVRPSKNGIHWYHATNGSSIIVPIRFYNPHPSDVTRLFCDRTEPRNKSAWIYNPLMGKFKEQLHSSRMEPSESRLQRVLLCKNTVASRAFTSPVVSGSNPLFHHAMCSACIARSVEC
jgi:hypothetical protein